MAESFCGLLAVTGVFFWIPDWFMFCDMDVVEVFGFWVVVVFGPEKNERKM